MRIAPFTIQGKPEVNIFPLNGSRSCVFSRALIRHNEHVNRKSYGQSVHAA
ncbi:hypothetical protein [Paenibacillus terrae]|uniref:hypothetical protein n=1 Tax=Paenibacillus terrae TaxID=159743 RepID=UPI0016568BD7|nr:hypothetical protein [Paenibacillus terrae]